MFSELNTITVTQFTVTENVLSDNYALIYYRMLLLNVAKGNDK